MPSDTAPAPASRPHPRLLLAVIIANLGGLQVGLQLALFSGILEMPSFAKKMPSEITSTTKAQITSAFLLGSIVGAAPAGPLCDRLGRRPALILIGLLSLLSALLQAISTKPMHLILSRLLAGFPYAVANVVCPMYTAELAPTHLRARLVNFYQLSITVGIFLAQAVNAQFWDAEEWNIPLYLSALPALVMVVAVFVSVPESPTFLLERGRGAEAIGAAHRLGLAGPVEAGVDVEGQGKEEKGSVWEMVMSRSGRKRLLIGTGIGAAQQLTGINAVIFFGPAVVGDVLGMKGEGGMFQAAAVVGFGNFAASVVSMGIVERFGRRRLLLGAGPFMVGSLVCLGMLRDLGVKGIGRWVGVGMVFVFVVAFAVTYGPLTFLVQSEVFPVRYKGVGMSVCSFVMTVLAVFVAATFLPLLEMVGGFVYFGYAACVVASSLFIYCYVPETRNLSLKDIDDLLIAEN